MINHVAQLAGAYEDDTGQSPVYSAGSSGITQAPKHIEPSTAPQTGLGVRQ
jgi:hypothetical protein